MFYSPPLATQTTYPLWAPWHLGHSVLMSTSMVLGYPVLMSSSTALGHPVSMSTSTTPLSLPPLLF